MKAQQDTRALARLYHVHEFADLKSLLFSLHTYYVLLIKLLAAELLSLQQGALLPSLAQQLPASPSELLPSRLHDLESNAWFEAQGIRNFLEADFFGWYLSSWNTEIDEINKYFWLLGGFALTSFHQYLRWLYLLWLSARRRV